MAKFNMEMNFCRRCGTALVNQGGPVYKCAQNHTIFLVAAAAIGLMIVNQKNEVLLLERAIDPGKGKLDIPGGFCDGPESLEEAVAREVEEEVGLAPSDYSKPEYVLSRVDAYDYEGETVPVSSIVYMAKLTTGKQPVAADDAASAEWVPLKELDLDKVYFPAIREGLEHLIKTQSA